MAPTCGVCHENESKYKCKTCEERYCSIACYKTHKITHEGNEEASTTSTAPQLGISSNGQNTQRHSPYTGFEHDPDFKRLMQRYPLLVYELQAAFAMTLEPGPDEQRTWRESDPFSDDHPSHFRSRGNKSSQPDEKLRGPWTQEKGDRQARDILRRMRRADDGEVSEGMSEFIKLCGIKFSQ